MTPASVPATKRSWQLATAFGGIALTGRPGVPVVKARMLNTLAAWTRSAGDRPGSPHPSSTCGPSSPPSISTSAKHSLAALEIGGAARAGTKNSPLDPTIGLHTGARSPPGWAREPAPVAGVMPALTQITDKIEVDRASAPQCHGGALGLDARAIGSDEHIGRECRPVRGDQFGQSLGACLLAHLNHEFGIKSQVAAALSAHRIERRHIDGVLTLVVGGPATIQPIAIARGDPGSLALRPRVLQAASPAPVPIAEHGGKLCVLNARGEQHRALSRHWVLEDAHGETQALEGGSHFRVQIAVQLCKAGGQQLALGPIGNTARQVGFEAAAVKVSARAAHSPGAGFAGIRHGLSLLGWVY